MRGAITLFLFLIISGVCAQTERCGFVNRKHTDQFEHWITSRLATARIQNSTVYMIPLVVHVLHQGDALGEGYNFPEDRIVAQIRTLNEDFRRMAGTPGFNNDPDGGDPLIEFVLAQKDPDGNPTNGIVRVDMTSVHPDPQPGDLVTLGSTFSYWDPNRYLNVWCLSTGLPPGLLLGSARFPMTDLEGGGDWESQPGGDGVFVNALNFGIADTLTDPNYGQGRTLTHEIGHFLGLLHTWGSINNSRQCDAYTDYCDDTPPIPVATGGCPAIKPTACDGRAVMIGNYMDGSYDACMNTFTNNQIGRMRTVLENSPQRKSLTTSPVIDRSGVVTGTDDPLSPSISLYPNPAKDKAYVSILNSEGDVYIRGYSLSGQLLFRRNDISNASDIELPLAGLSDQVIIIVVQADGKTTRFTLAISAH